MDDRVLVLAEPALEFRYAQSLTDPHDGLAMFGPYDADLASQPRKISYGLVGSHSGIGGFSAWSERIQAPIRADGLNRRLWPIFPGFEVAFGCSWPLSPTRSVALDEEGLIRDAREKDPNKRASRVVDRYLSSIERISKSDDRIDVVVCVVPDLVYENCRPESRVAQGSGYRPSPHVRRQREFGQTDLFDEFNPAIYQFSVDFRRQIKARSMEYRLPIQIIRESTLGALDSTLTGRKQLTPPSDRAWNLSVALYYKSGGKPWRLATARPGVCYVGLAYRRKDPTSSSPAACCAAQMFLDTGDGIVFMGEYGPWYSRPKNAFHLTRVAARSLLRGALETYQQLDGRPLLEVFLHCRSSLNDEEFAGFSEACPRDVKLVGIRIRRESFGARLFREGTRPVLRGTFWRIGPRAGYLWGTGFKPRLATYDGWEVPVPLRIDVQHGSADIEQVASDVLGLTKLNYNACRLGEGEPVTIKFSDAVGEILVSNPTVAQRSPKFKFYI